jgi:hypothetical protein
MDAEVAAILHDPERFRALVGEEARRFFGRTLPGYLDRYHRGRGLHLLHKLMLDTEAGGLEQPERKPTAWARRTSRAALRQVAVRVFPAQPYDEGIVLGTFTWERRERTSALGQIHSRTTRVIELYQASFAQIAPANVWALRHRVAVTIAHEFVHFLESFQPEGERSLAIRERGGETGITLEEARRRDDRFVKQRAAAWAAFGLVAALPFVAWAWSVWG